MTTGHDITEQASDGFMKLSVIIPCLNAADTIARQLEALANQHCSEPWEIIVSDNGSRDETRVILQRYKQRLPNLRVIDASTRRGQPYALNVGAQAAIGDALLFCDADDEVAPGWLAAMAQALREYDFVACRIDPEKLNQPWVRESRANSQRDGLQKLPWFPYLPHAGGGTIGVKRQLHESVGGFDESLPLLHDTYYCLRLQHAGTKLHFVPNAVVHVGYRDTLSAIYRQARAYGAYSVLVYKKSREWGMPEIPWTDSLVDWLHLLRRLLRVRSKGKCANWLFHFGYRVGRLWGSLKHRALAI